MATPGFSTLPARETLRCAKPYLTGGVGAIWNIGTRYALDASYRYGRILARPSEIDGDTRIDVNRARLGVAVHF
jgi:hypothetical protein